MSRETDLDAAAALLVLALRGKADLDLATLRTIHVELGRRVGRSSARSDDDVEELVDMVLVRFVQAARRRRIEPETAGAYLARSVRNAAIDAHRASARQPIPFVEGLVMNAPIDDDGLARLLAEDAARTDVLRGLRHAAGDERFTVVRVVTEWLQQAEITGEGPSSRQVGFALDLSHSTVNAALNEFRTKYLPKPFQRS